MVLFAKILLWEISWHFIMRSGVPHFPLNYPPLTSMAVPYCIDLAVCISDAYVVVWGGIHIGY